MSKAHAFLCTLAALAAVFLYNPAKADAAPGCHGLTRTIGWHFHRTSAWWTPTADSAPIMHKVGNTWWVYANECDNHGLRHDWFESQTFYWCWHTGDHRFFNGVTYNGHTGDDHGELYNPGPIHVPDHPLGHNHLCRSQLSTAWHRTHFHDHPFAKGYFTDNVKIFHDTNWAFKYKGMEGAHPHDGAALPLSRHSIDYKGPYHHPPGLLPAK